MNKLKLTAAFACKICGKKIKRTKTLHVKSDTVEGAQVETQVAKEKWIKSIKNQKCKVCYSILRDLGIH